MGCRHVSLLSSRAARVVVAGGLALAACTSTGDVSPADEPASADASSAVEDDAADEPTTSDPDADRPAEPDGASTTDEEALAAGYQDFLGALTAAMEAGDPDLPELAEHADDAGLVSAQAMVVSLTESDRIARGELVASIESLEVDGDVAELEDCYRADLIEYDADTDEQVADRGGARFAATVEFERDPAGNDDGAGDTHGHGEWIVTGFEQGDVCAPGELAAEVTDRYLAFWDAVWSAADPPDPDHAGLAETAAGEHLTGLQAQLTRLRDDGHVRRGRGTEHPIVAYVTAHDTEAVVRDCVEEVAEGGIYDAATGEKLEGDISEGQRTLLETRLEVIDGDWRVVNVNVEEEDSSCEPDGS